MKSKLTLAIIVAGLLALLAPTVPVHAAASVVQATSSGIVSIGSGGTAHNFGANVTTGNAVVVQVVTGAASAPDLSVSDATNGSYTQASENSNNDVSAATFYKCNVTGGFTAVTATSSTTGNGMIAIFEVSGLGSCGTVHADSNGNTNISTTSHAAHATGATQTGFSVCGAQGISNPNYTAGTGYTKIGPSSGNPDAGSRYAQYGVSTWSSNTCTWITSVSSTTAATGVFIAEAGGGGGGGSPSASIFPNAVGYSASRRNAYQGSATPQICRVTNLNNSGDGSLREALEGAGGGTSEIDCNGNPRIVLCETSGYVTLSTPITINDPYVYWAGQTCPSPGMTVRDNYILIDTHDVLLRHVRIRPGVFNGVDLDGITIFTNASNETTNIFIDHSSLTWATDENFGMSGGIGNPDNIDLQHSIMAEALVDAVACETVEACANTLIYPDRTNVSLIGNAIAMSITRCPNIYSGASVYVANNVIYRCENTMLLTDHPNSDNPILVTAIGNVFKRESCFSPPCYGIYSVASPAGSQLYMNDNVMVGTWGGVFTNASGTNPTVGSPPMSVSGYTPIAGSATLASVTTRAGAYPAFRDAVDQRILDDIINNTGDYIDDPADEGGFPSLATNTIDHSAGAHPRPASPHADDDNDGYKNIEEWLQNYACEVEGGSGCWPSAGTIIGAHVRRATP